MSAGACTHSAPTHARSMHTLLQAAEILTDPLLTDRQEDQSEVSDGEGGRGKMERAEE